MIRRILTLWWLAAAPIWAVDDAPSRQALDFLGKVRAGKVELKSGTDSAVSPATLPAKLTKIERRLETLMQDLGDAKLVALESKIDAELAAVLVEAGSGIDPRQRTVVAVALVQRDGKWLAAPWPGSFANAGLPYDPETRRRASELESWMMTESAQRAARLREDAANTLRAGISAKLSSEAWAAMEPRQVLDAFLQACAARDSLMLAALCGGLIEEPAESWSRTLGAMQALLAPEQAGKFPWRWLVSPEVLRLPMQEDDDNDDAKVWSLAVLDPEGTAENPGKPALGVLDLELTNPDGQGWRVRPPNWNFDNEDGVGTTIDDDQVGALADALNQNIPAKPEPSADAAARALLDALHGSSLPAVLARLHRHDDAPLLRRSLMTAASTWKRNLTSRDFLRWNEVYRQESPGHALLLLHPFSSRNPDEGELVAFYLLRQPGGWLWTASPEKSVTQAYQEEITRQRDAWQKDWQERITRESSLIKEIPPDTKAPDEPATRKLVADWLKHCQSGDMHQALGLTARFALPDSNRLLLRHLAQQLQRSRTNLPAAEWVKFGTTGPWSVVTLREVDALGAERFPVMLVISTPQGPRLIPEFDWLAKPGRSREFLNKTSLGRISKVLPDAAESISNLLKEP
jgi:hypothetical protein